jgi:hypothetical protein
VLSDLAPLLPRERALYTLIRCLFLLLGAAAAWSFWITEVYWVKGWSGLAWLSGFNWGAVPICALITIMCAYFFEPGAEAANKVKFIVVGFVLTIASFVAGRFSALDLFSGNISGALPLKPILILASAGIAVSVGLTISANRWLAPLHLWTIALLAIGLLLVLPFSFATIRVFPALNGSTDEIHAIKMGYPVFWTTLLAPTCLWLGRKGPSFDLK